MNKSGRSFLYLGSILALALLPTLASAQFDHMRCFKIKDSAKFDAEASLSALQTQFGINESCEIKGKGKMFCVPVSKTVTGFLDKSKNGIPQVNLIGPELAYDSICYKIKCPKRELSPELVTDQFGSRTVEKFKSSLLCTPAIKGLPTSTSTTTTTTVTTTTTSTTTSVPTTCQPGETDCGNGVCANLGTDPNNCGACGNACAQGEVCTNGQCVSPPTCQPGETDCGNGVCANLGTDPSNCGACGNACAQGEVCTNGQCVSPPTCQPGETDCGNGVCANLGTDPSNCGACGNACAQGDVCTNGSCVTTACDFLQQNCSAGLACYPTGACDGNTVGTCSAAGAGQQGAACAVSTDCAAGFICVDLGGGNLQCLELCDLQQGTCGTGGCTATGCSGLNICF